jgi:hypothetical protein
MHCQLLPLTLAGSNEVLRVDPGVLLRAAALLLVLCVGRLGAVPAAAQDTLYVDADAAAPGDGQSWSSAYPALQDALDQATVQSGTDYEIWVAEGVYYPDNDNVDHALNPDTPTDPVKSVASDGTEHVAGRPDESFTLRRDGVALYGGFRGDEGRRSARDPSANKVVLSGDVDGDDADPDGDAVTEGVGDINGQNSYHVLFLDGGGEDITGATVIDGVVVTAGDARGTSPNDRGGGLFCDGSGSGNRCNPTLQNVVFVGNRAAGDGGALFNDGRSGGTASPAIANAVFVANEATFGGALYNDGGEGASSPSVTGGTFASNRALDNGGALYNDGGGGTSAPTVVNTILRGNTADGGEEVYNTNSGATPTLSHSLIQKGPGQVQGASFGLVEDTIVTDAPVFADVAAPDGPDGRFGTVDDGVNQGLGAPGLDAGTTVPFEPGGVAENVTTDITGASRIQDLDADGTPIVNLGAYESVAPQAPTVRAGPVLGATGATLGGVVNPGAAEATIRFRLFPAGAPEQDTLLEVGTRRGAVAAPVRATVRTLAPDSRYRMVIEARNREGNVVSEPVAFETPPAPALQAGGGAQTLSVRLAAGGAASDSTVFVRRGRTGDFQPLPLSPADGQEQVLTATVPSSVVTPAPRGGVDYYVALPGGTEGLRLPTGTPQVPPLNLPVGFDTLSAPAAQADALFPREAYRMVSIPARADVPAALRRAYGAYSRSRWRLLQWDPTDGAGAYRSFPDLSAVAFRPGRAFWLISVDGTPLGLRSGQTVDASAPKAVEVKPGWNQLGNPFGFAVPWAAVTDTSGVGAAIGAPLTYRNGEYREGTVLRPWEGYFVFNAASEAKTLLIPPVRADGMSEQNGTRRLAATRSARGSKAGGAYTLRVTARSGEQSRSRVWLGTRSGARPGRDTFDVAQPPPVEPTVRLSAGQGKETSSAVPYMKSVKPVRERGQTWLLRLHRPEQGETTATVRLNWSEVGTRPEGHRRYVVDVSDERRITPGGSVSLKKGETKRLRVIVGPERYAQKHSAGAALSGYDTELRGNYPNPFEEATTLEYTLREEQSVTIEVYNILGQRVRTLVEEKKAAGRHRTTWKGRNRYGRRVGSGVYFCRIDAGAFTASTKMMLVR